MNLPKVLKIGENNEKERRKKQSPKHNTFYVWTVLAFQLLFITYAYLLSLFN